MKTYSRKHLPDTIEYRGETYTYNSDITNAWQNNDRRTPLTTIAATLRKEGRKAILVKVLHPNLRGREDFHGKPYQPSQWIFTTNKNKTTL